MKRARSSFIAAVCLASLPTAFAGAQGGVQIARAQAQARLSPHQTNHSNFMCISRAFTPTGGQSTCLA